MTESRKQKMTFVTGRNAPYRRHFEMMDTLVLLSANEQDNGHYPCDLVTLKRSG